MGATLESSCKLHDSGAERVQKAAGCFGKLKSERFLQVPTCSYLSPLQFVECSQRGLKTLTKKVHLKMYLMYVELQDQWNGPYFFS